MKSELTVVNPDDFKIVVLSDGTTTTAEIIQREHVGYQGLVESQVGYGIARRRSGDKRNPDLGVRLALSRALRDAADKVDEVIEKVHGGDA